MFNQQNTDQSIQLLSAMRYFYDVAKRIKVFIIGMSILLPIVYLAYRYSTNILQINLGYDKQIISIGLVWIVILYFLEKFAESYISKGAKTQEKFDSIIFEIPINDILMHESIGDEEIYDASQAYRGNKGFLEDWYGKINEKSPHYLKVLIAQRMNIMWGNELKMKLQSLMYWGLGLLFIFTICIGIYLNLDFINSLIFLILPLIPLYLLGMKTLHLLNKQVKNNKKINDKILKDCEHFNDYPTDEIKTRCRVYQDYIYSENRLRTVLIPNWFYRLYRDNMDKKMHEINKKFLDRYV